MKQIPLYSLVIFPNPEQSQIVKSFKNLLKKEVGWFGSANAAAHLTIINLESETEFNQYISEIREFCRKTRPQQVALNSWDSFGERTFFIAPDQLSKLYFDQLIINLHRHLGISVSKAHAHLSIARGLDAEKMKAAYRIFGNTEINMEFFCDALYVRKYNPQTKQYSDIVEKIPFEGFFFDNP